MGLSSRNSRVDTSSFVTAPTLENNEIDEDDEDDEDEDSDDDENDDDLDVTDEDEDDMGDDSVWSSLWNNNDR